MKALKRAFMDANEYDMKIIDKICVSISLAWIKAEEKAEDSNNSTTADNVEAAKVI